MPLYSVRLRPYNDDDISYMIKFVFVDTPPLRSYNRAPSNPLRFPPGQRKANEKDLSAKRDQA